MSTATLFEMPIGAAHPAKYTDVLLPTMADFLRGSKRILDPFGGTGKVFLLERWLGDVEIQAVEIEPEWAARNPRITLGNALHLPWPDGYFDAICTSPTYGNRMADKWSSCTTKPVGKYAWELQRELHPDNSGTLQWGDAYRDFHRRAWTEARRVLRPGGAFVLNIKNHIRGGEIVRVTNWQIECLESLGFARWGTVNIPTPSMRTGRNRELRVPYESVIHFHLEVTP